MTVEAFGGLRPLVIDDEVRRRVAALVEYASAPEHHFDPAAWLALPEALRRVPGDHEEHVVQLGTYRVVFSVDRIPGGDFYRHMSVSVPAEIYPKLHLPSPLGVLTICCLLGFTGAVSPIDGPEGVSILNERDVTFPKDWHIQIDRKNAAIDIAQRKE